MEVQEVLQKCTVEGMVIKLPPIQLERKAYTDVKNKLELIGGKWKGGKVQGFIFNEDPTDLLAEAAGGAQRNIKKEFQFFATPDRIADKMVRLANITKGQTILEPSAGQGAIIQAIQRAVDTNVYCCELMPLNQTFLNRITGAMIVGTDFLEYEPLVYGYDRIIANPPFTKNQDIDHVRHMYHCLKPGGRLVSVMGTSWQMGSQKKQEQFRDWIYEVGANVIDIEQGAFKESGTMVKTVIVVINKPL